MTDPQTTREPASHQVVRRPRRGVHLLVLAVLVSACVPYPQGYPPGSYPPGSYPPGAYPQDPYRQAPSGRGGGASYAMRVVYEPPTKKPARDEIRQFLQATEAFEKFSHGLSQMFDLPQDVNVVWKECGTVNASWDGQGNIVMCYEMAEFLKTLFSKKVKDRKQLRVAVMSSLMFVFLHELGHGLIAMYQLPSVGREEDAADQLAGLVLIATGSDAGLEVALQSAQFFRLLALAGPKTPFFDEHSLDAQRHYNLLCLVYGSSPERLGSLVGNDKLPASRARRCPREYSKISAAWEKLLQPHVRRRGYADQPSAPAPRSRGTSGYEDTTDRGGEAPRSPGTSSSSSGPWSCRVVGSYAPAGSSGPDYGDVQNVDITLRGRTREEAGYAAIDACADILHLNVDPTLSPGALQLEPCKVVSCSR